MMEILELPYPFFYLRMQQPVGEYSTRRPFRMWNVKRWLGDVLRKCIQLRDAAWGRDPNTSLSLTPRRNPVGIGPRQEH